MWYLTSENDPRIIYVLPGQDIIIGRNADGQNCNFAVPVDSSLSRKHATLFIADNNLTLQDLSSKYGTFVNNSTDKLDCNLKLNLNVNDNVKFGKLNCEWKVQKAKFVTCTSTLKGENIQNLKMTLAKLGGVLKTDWDDSCTYLTMPAITLTIKVVLALVQGSYIVRTDYWNKCLEAVTQNANLPDPTHFTPEIVESTLNKESVSFLPNDARKSLFAGKNIIFFSKRQLEMYNMVLEKSSATASLLSDKKITKSMLCANDVIVIQYNITSVTQDTESQREQIKDIVNYLKGKGKRVVADAEIGLAILYCSLEKYCNPDFNFTLEVMKQPIAQETKANSILAQESQNQAVLSRENIKIDQSLTIKEEALGHDDLIVGKRKLNEDEVTIHVSKKMATENSLVVNNGNKRPADENDDIQTNPSKKLAMSTDDDSFNFIQTSNKNAQNSTKLLNLMKPTKRKFEQDDEEEGLFNFVTKKAATEQNANNSDAHTDLNNGDNSDPQIVSVSSATFVNDKIDVAALRGTKLLELIEQNSKLDVKNVAMKIVKTEDNDSEVCGATVVEVRNDLIVKREPMSIKEDQAEIETSRVKNFKKFKKVWPLKIQVSMSKLSLSVV